MITNIVQRWRDRRDSYRPAGEVFDPRDFDVAEIDGDGSDTLVKAFVMQHHYEGTYPPAIHRFGLYRRDELVGVAVYDQPVNNKTLAVISGEGAQLGRFVLLDDVRANAETWFIRRCRELLVEKGVAGVVAFSDPTPRTRADGSVRFKGHIGTIYQAASAVYVGLSKAEHKYLLPDGRTMHNRVLTKIRKRERDGERAMRLLVSFGAEPLRDDEDAAAWVYRWIRVIGRRFKHPGNHKYVMPFTSAARRAAEKLAKRYPKIAPSAAALAQ